MKFSKKPQFADNLKYRIGTSKYNKALYRDIGESNEKDYLYIEGYYPGSIYSEEKQKEISLEVLSGVEKGIYNTLKKRISEGDKKPIIAIDFGGMYGTSFIKIAKELEKDGCVSRGDCVLIVSNLDADPDFSSKGISEEIVKFVKDNQYLIKRVVADAADLYKGFVNVAGVDVPIRGNVAFVHESKTLMHSHQADVDFLLLAKLLVNKGIMLFQSQEQEIRYSVNDPEVIEYNNSRVVAHEKGIKNLNSLYGFFYFKETDYQLRQRLDSLDQPDGVKVDFDDFS